MSLLKTLVDGQTLIPDLLRSAFQAREVLDKYGLRGCGGPLGPMETLSFFAKAHDVPLDQLLKEIHEILDTVSDVEHQPEAGDSTSLSASSNLADTIYRPFFIAGITVILTLGATWGAYLLLKIGFSGQFSAVGIHEVNAHGHAQIFGWAGLFVMGFAYQAFPRFKHTTLRYPRLAMSTLWLMIIGIVGRSLLETAGVYAPALWHIAVFFPLLEIVAIGLFVWIISVTLHGSEKPLAFYDGFILCALFWFWIQSIYAAVLFAATVWAPDREALLAIVATWQAPLREIQIHGFALLMIFGVSQRIFHHFYGFRKPNAVLGLWALVGLNAGLIGEITGFVLMRTVSHAWAALWYGGILMLALSAIVLVCHWRIFSKPDESDRSLKFLRTAYIWLFISLGMLVLLPLYQFGLLSWFAPGSESATIGFSHAYYGAIRHAITVGFISLMIVGVSSKVVPTLNGVNLRGLSGLWIPFLLINFGCAFRVFGQTLTDFFPVVFPFTGVSGIFEVTGLAVWGFHLLAIMAGRVRIRTHANSDVTALYAGESIQGHHRVGDVLEYNPHLLNTFLEFGFKPLANAVLRRTVARTISINDACRRFDVDANSLLSALNEAKQQQLSSSPSEAINTTVQIHT